MESWMTKFDNNLSTIIGLLSRLESLLLGLQVPFEQMLSIETFACEENVGELHVVEGGVMANKSLDEGVVVDRITMGSPLVETQPTHEYLGFT
jgi:hypothetical protein